MVWFYANSFVFVFLNKVRITTNYCNFDILMNGKLGCFNASELQKEKFNASVAEISVSVSRWCRSWIRSHFADLTKSWFTYTFSD